MTPTVKQALSSSFSRPSAGTELKRGSAATTQIGKFQNHGSWVLAASSLVHAAGVRPCTAVVFTDL